MSVRPLNQPRSVNEGRSDIGMVSRGLRPDETADLECITIALDALVFIVNVVNPITDINR